METPPPNDGKVSARVDAFMTLSHKNPIFEEAKFQLGVAKCFCIEAKASPR